MKTNLTSRVNKAIIILGRIVAVGALALLARNAQSQTISIGNLYQNSTTFLNTDYNYPANGEAGNEVALAGSSSQDLITSFSMDYDFAGSTPNGNEMADVRFYANNGTPYNGYATPGTVLFDSGSFAIGGFQSGATFNFPLADITGTGAGLTANGVIVPQDFTWTITFSGLTGADTAGLALYNPPTVGSDALPNGDAWINTGGGWEAGNNSGAPLVFGAVFNGTGIAAVPDSSFLSISVFSVLAGFGWMKRFQRRA